MTEAPEMRRGCFLTVEGGEGVGKSSNMAFIADCLRERGITVRQTREPGGTPFAEAVRQLLLDRESAPMPDEAELLLIFAARASHVRDVIKPALARGEWVLCDRFTDASYAYQGAGRELGEEAVAWLEQWVQGSLRPDLTLLLDAPVAVGFARADQRGARDRFESEVEAFFERIRQAYLARARAEPERFRVVDASHGLQAVQGQIQALLDDYLKQWQVSGTIRND
ncbi:dTMP kinase [Natronospira sp. AB-CW4]|uniref:Thymidylate kinase n=1 Tax=Natronospira bacteriovora TaxID=3069753 RepID=A0ABU0W5G9_9GAMM|nr:dTMP kinase [Natronospira sp. AB-CW4]MDQ2069259.1 dTMP kinase [Natronospira sp. AB-CW4]